MMKRNPYGQMLLLLSLPLLFSGCSSTRLPDSEPHIRGVITNTNIADELRQILVEENPNETSGSQKAAIRLKGDTQIFRRVGLDLEEIGSSELALGKTVSVWFEGPVAESYPVQATATVIVLESH